MTISVQAAHVLLHLSSLLGNLGLFLCPWFNEALEASCSCQQGCRQETHLWEKGSEPWDWPERAALPFPALLPPFPLGVQASGSPVLCSLLQSYPREGDSGVLPGCHVFTPKATQRNCLRSIREVLRQISGPSHSGMVVLIKPLLQGQKFVGWSPNHRDFEVLATGSQRTSSPFALFLPISQLCSPCPPGGSSSEVP